MFPIKTYLINLDKDKERLKYVTNECKNNGIIPVRVSGILGSSLSPDDIEKNTTPFCKMFCTKSAIGCALSNMKCWSNIIDNNDPEAMIIEDDVKFEPDFLQLFSEKYQDLPSSYDICFVGHCGLFKSGQEISDNIYIPKSIACMHCYLVSNKGAKKLLLFNKISGHIDIELSNNIEKFEAYAFSPDLAYQKSEFRTDSNNVNIGFPYLLNRELSKLIDSDGRPMDYQFSVPLYQVNGYPINIWAGVFLLFGLIFGFLINKYRKLFYICSTLFIIFILTEYNLNNKYYKDIIGTLIITIIGFLFIFLLHQCKIFENTIKHIK